MSNYYQPDPTIEHFEEQTDEWHTHGGSEPAPQASHGEVSPKWISIGLIVSFIGVFLAIAFFAYLFKIERDYVVAETREIDTGASYVELSTRAKAELSSVGWMDEKAGVARVPIALAMKDVVASYEKAQVAPEPARAPAKPAPKPAAEKK